MKYLHVSDTHIRIRSDPRYNQDLVAVLQSILTLVAAERPDYVVHSGDLFDSAHPTASEMALATAVIKRILDISPMIIIRGNHDMRDNADTQDTLKPLANLKIPGLHVLEEPGLYSLPGVDVLALPFIYRGREEALGEIRRLHDAYTGNNLIFVGHFWVPDYLPVSGNAREFTVPVSYLQALTKVKIGMIGHIHLAGQVAQNFRYAGSPFRIDWGEKEESKTVTLYADSMGGYSTTLVTTPALPAKELDFAAVTPADLQLTRHMIKIHAQNVEIKDLVALDEIQNTLLKNGNFVVVDLKLKEMRFNALTPDKKDVGFDAFMGDYVKKHDIPDKLPILLEICKQIIGGRITAETPILDIPELKLRLPK